MRLPHCAGSRRKAQNEKYQFIEITFSFRLNVVGNGFVLKVLKIYFKARDNSLLVKRLTPESGTVEMINYYLVKIK